MSEDEMMVRWRRWAVSSQPVQAEALRRFAERRGLEAPAAGEVACEVLASQEHPAAADFDEALREAFDVKVVAPVRASVVEFGKAIRPFVEALQLSVRAIVAVADHIATVCGTLEFEQVDCVCLCGQHPERRGVCEGSVPAPEAVTFELPGNGAYIRVCAACSDARQAGPGGHPVRIDIT